MSDLMVWMGLLAGEIMLVIFILLFASWLRNSAARRKDTKAMAKLIAQVRKNKSDRAKLIEQFLEQKMGLNGEALNDKKIQLLREEMRLIQRFSDVYKRRDSAAAAQFFMCVEGMLEPYYQLSAGVSTSADDGEEDDELSFLRSENVRLSEELSVTMDTMSRMLNEYSTMFSSSTPEEEAEENPTGMVMPENEQDKKLSAELGVEDRELTELDEVELDISEANVADDAKLPNSEGAEETEEVELDAAAEESIVEIPEDEEVELTIDESVNDDVDSILDAVATDNADLTVDESVEENSEVAVDDIDSILDATSDDESLFDSDEVVDLEDEKKEQNDSVVI